MCLMDIYTLNQMLKANLLFFDVLYLTYIKMALVNRNKSPTQPGLTLNSLANEQVFLKKIYLTELRKY